MGSEALLQQACELAFAVAREDAKTDPSIEPPGDMRSFLYLARLPRRAIAVAQQAIEDDSGFRARVASRATEADVGRAGFLWLHRPIGWAPEFEDLSQSVEGDGGQADNTGEIVDDDGNIGSGSPLQDLTDADTENLSSDHKNVGGDLSTAALASLDGSSTNGESYDAEGQNTEMVSALPDELDPEADAIENELTSLRGLVDRLAGERELVMSGPSSDSVDNQGVSLLEDELATTNTELQFAREELNRVNQELGAMRQEREDAQRQQSDALRRQVDVEREMAQVREDRAEIETRASDLQVNLISAEDRLKRLEADLDEVDRERNVAQSQLETMTVERNQIREDRMAIKAERDGLQARLAEVDEKTGGVDVGELTSANRSLTQELEATSRELARMIAQVESYEDQLRTTTTTADSLKSEKVELTSRLADAELSLETTKTQYVALKDDAERLASDVGSLRAERDGLQSQLTELQASLSDVLDEHAEIRHRNDADRKSLNELRVERDVLLARMSDIEQADRSHENRVNALAKERDDLLTARDDLVVERGELRGEVAAAASARDQLLEKIDGLETRLGPLETELQAERRQREELANRLLELDDIAARNHSAIGELTSERDLLSGERVELAERVQLYEAERVDVKKLSAERDDLQVRLERTETQRDDEANRRLTSVTEISEQVSQLESAKTNLEQQTSEAQSELGRVRSDIDELNRENAKLRFNLQVAESSVVEATDAAEQARKSAAQATAKAAAAEARADRSESAAATASSLAGIEQLVSSPKPPGPGSIAVQTDAAAGESTVVDELQPSAGAGIVEADASTETGLVDIDPPVIALDSDAQAHTPLEVGDQRSDLVDRAEPNLDAAASAGGISAMEVAEELPGQLDDGDRRLSGAAPSLLELPDEMAGKVSIGESAMPLGESFVSGDEDLSAVESSFDAVPAADRAATIPGFAPANDVVDIDEHRGSDATNPFNNDWKPVGEASRESDELDEISQLISATVSGFDNPVDGAVPEPPTFGDQGDFVDDASPPSVFAMGDGEAETPFTFDGGSEALPPEFSSSDESGSASRRQIEIPADIVDDEIAIALHVVSSPDVVLLVDGDSVAKLGWPSLPVAQQRDALVTYLADLSASSGAAPDVVFDGRIGDDDSLPVSRAVRIRLSTPPTEPAAALDELVSAYPDRWPIALVTDESSLASSARGRGAVVLNNGQLLDLFIAQ